VNLYLGIKLKFLPLEEPHFLLAVSCSVELYLKQGHGLFSVEHHSTAK